MIHTDDTFGKRVEEAVARLEKRTDAEVVVVAAERSGSYLDVALLGGGITAAVVLTAVVAMPWPVHPVSVVLDTVIAGALAAWILNGRRWLRLLVPTHRKRNQVELQAHAEFSREAVYATPNRTGLLVYLSSLEGQVKLLPDVGLEAQIPKGMWAEAADAFAHDDLEHFVAGLDAVGALLAERVPATEGSDDFNMPDAPMIR